MRYLALALGLLTVPAWADGFPIESGIPLPVPYIIGSGAVLLCNEYGCRSSPYIPPPIVPVQPLTIYAPYPQKPIGPKPFYQPRFQPPAPVPSVAEAAPRVDPIPAPMTAAPMTQDQEREAIIRQGEAFCQKYGKDPICHPIKQ
jgi:hypothetical protein